MPSTAWWVLVCLLPTSGTFYVAWRAPRSPTRALTQYSIPYNGEGLLDTQLLLDAPQRSTSHTPCTANTVYDSEMEAKREELECKLENADAALREAQEFRTQLQSKAAELDSASQDAMEAVTSVQVLLDDVSSCDADEARARSARCIKMCEDAMVAIKAITSSLAVTATEVEAAAAEAEQEAAEAERAAEETERTAEAERAAVEAVRAAEEAERAAEAERAVAEAERAVAEAEQAAEEGRTASSGREEMGAEQKTESEDVSGEEVARAGETEAATAAEEGLPIAPPVGPPVGPPVAPPVAPPAFPIGTMEFFEAEGAIVEGRDPRYAPPWITENSALMQELHEASSAEPKPATASDPRLVGSLLALEELSEAVARGTREGRLTVIKYYAPWCRSCLQASPCA